MSLELKIDTNALMTLFPEGSETRLNLSQAVIEEAVKRMIKSSSTAEVVKIAGEASRKVSDEVTRLLIENYFTRSRTGFDGLEMKPGFKAVISSRVLDLVNEAIGNSVDSQIKFYEPRINKMVHAAVTSQVKLAIKKAVDDELEAHREFIQTTAKEMVLKALNLTK